MYKYILYGMIGLMIFITGYFIGAVIHDLYYLKRRTGVVRAVIDKKDWTYRCTLEPDNDATNKIVDKRGDMMLFRVVYEYTDSREKHTL